MNMTKHAISLLVSNKPGVLTRITLVFARRGFNIDSLVVSQGQKAEFSRMNIEATGDERASTLMLAQLNRLVDVIHAVDHTADNVIQTELALVKINCTAENRNEAILLSETFRCQALDISEDTITFQITGKSSKVNAFQKMMEPFGILEMVRTGKVLMSRGTAATA
ncbi:MAG: acetolactate synthase small subunit [Spirochaeta sp. LUC14_002_19_P3]|nr:MAG: acetolactate synthase small subunit [Spirochaeta sp. LUC14_002_19_P3]